MNLEDLRNSKKPFVTAAEIAPVLGSDPNSIRLAAHTCPERLGFPVTVIRHRVKIPRIPFLLYLGETEGDMK